MTNQINNKTASTNEWNKLCDILDQVNSTRKNEVIRDGNVTEAEMEHVLDSNGDGKITYTDFSKYDQSMLRLIRDVLERHDFKIFNNLWKNNGRFSIEYCKEIPRAFWNDKEFVLNAVIENPSALYFANPRLKDDVDIVLSALKNEQYIMDYGKRAVPASIAIILMSRRFSGNPPVQNHSPDKYYKAGSSLAYAGPSIKNNKKIALDAVKMTGWALQHVSDSLKNDKDVVLAAVKKDGLALKHANPSLQKNKQIVLAAVRNDGNALQFAPSFKNDRSVVSEAIKQNGTTIQYADDNLKKDKKLALMAIENNGNAFQFIDNSLQGDESLLLNAIQTSPLMLEHANENLKKNEVCVCEATLGNIAAFRFADMSLRTNADYVISLVTLISDEVLNYADSSLLRDKTFISSLVKIPRTLLSIFGNDYTLFHYAVDRLKKDRTFATQIVTSNWRTIVDVDESIRNGVWYDVVKNKYGFDKFFNDSELNGLSAFKAALWTKYNISHLERIDSLNTLKDILTNRSGSIPQASTRKTAFIIAPKNYWGVYAARNPVADWMFKSGFKVMYYEAGSDEDVKTALDQAVQSGGSPADVVIFTGESDERGILMADKSVSDPRYEEDYLNPGDFTENGAIDIKKYVKAGGNVIVDLSSYEKLKQEKASEIEAATKLINEEFLKFRNIITTQSPSDTKVYPSTLIGLKQIIKHK